MTGSDKNAVYVIDTCVWVNFHDHHSLPQVLAQLRSHANSGSIKALAKVMDELKRRWTPIHKEVRKLPVHVRSPIELAPNVVTLAGKLLHAHPFLGRPLSPYDTADPWIIAAAEVHGWTVVTDEGTGKRRSKSVKGVCERRGVPCLDRHEFANTVKIRL